MNLKVSVMMEVCHLLLKFMIVGEHYGTLMEQRLCQMGVLCSLLENFSIGIGGCH